MKSRRNYSALLIAFLVLTFTEWLARWELYAAETCDKIAFAPPQYFPTGGSPLNVAVADFDGDGNQDFVVNTETNLVVYFSNGRGGFRGAETISLGGYHQGLAAGDFNGDGKPDLAVTNFYEQTVSILLNDGRGGFGSPSTFPTGGNADKVAVGDFNNDKKLDLAVITGAPFPPSNVTILLGNGAGGFGPPTSFPLPNGPTAITVADFNNDGNLDVAISTYDSMKVKVLLGDGKGHLVPGNAYSLDSNSFAIVAGDFNGDGNVDLAASVENIYPNNHVAIFLGDGSGAFTLAQKVYVPGVTGLATADFNGDGNLDIAAATYFFNTVDVALGDGTGQFGAPQALPLAHPRRLVYDVVVGDFNGDGKPDLATANYDTAARFKGGDSAVLLNVPRVNITAPDPSASEPGTDTGKFRVTRTGCTLEPLVVHYVVSGTATPNQDYEGLSGKVIIPAGRTGAFIDVIPLDDSIKESPETVTLTLSQNAAYYIGGHESATVLIYDND